MDDKQAFLILGIDMCKDEDSIRKAYREKLVNVNPEDDPEGFKSLREAYETACQYVRKEEQEEERELTESEAWLKDIEAVYSSIKRRQDLEEWRELFSREICMNLDTEEECRKGLLNFLANHFRLPSQVWKQIGETWGFGEQKEALYEEFPKNFVDFVAVRCEKGDWLPYEHFQGDDQGEYDLFIRLFFELSDKMEEGSLEGAKSILQQADALEIRHPYMELERARVYCLEGRKDEANQIVDQVVSLLGDDERVVYIAARVKWDTEHFDEAAEFFQKVLDTTPQHVLANQKLGAYYLEKQDYKKSKDYTISALRTGARSKELDEQLEAANENLILSLENQVEEEPENMKVRLDLGWCYLQNDRSEKGIGLLSKKLPGKEDEEEYYNLLQKMHYSLNQFKEAEECLKKLENILEKKTESLEGEEKEEKIGNRVSVNIILARLYEDQWETEKDKTQLLDQAEAELKKAGLLMSDHKGVLMESARVKKLKEDFKAAIDFCTEVLEKEPDYFPAYMMRQECYSGLKDARGVIDDFYAMHGLYPGYVKMYELAAEVYCELDYPDRLKNLDEMAKEQNISSLLFEYYKAKSLRKHPETREDVEKSRKMLRDILEQNHKEEEPENKLTESQKADTYLEISLCCDQLRDKEEALAMVRKAREIDQESIYYIWIEALMLRGNRKYEEALECYEKCREEYEDVPSLYYGIGDCYVHMGKRQEAIPLFEKMLELDPEDARANDMLTDIYSWLLENKRDKKYLEKGIVHADRQLELTQEAYYYIARGILYLNGCVWDKAEADFMEAAKLDPENGYAYCNAGRTYRYQGQYEQARKMLEKAFQLGKDEDNAFFYEELGVLYYQIREYEKAAKVYEECCERFPGRKKFLQKLADVYEEMGKFKEALECLKKAYGSGTAKFYEKATDIYMSMDDLKKADACNKKAANKRDMGVCSMTISQALEEGKIDDYSYYSTKGNLLACQGKLKAAEKAFFQSVKAAKDSGDMDDYEDALKELAEFFYWFKKDKVQAAKIAEEGLKSKESRDYLNEEHISDLYYSRAILYRCIAMCLFSGQLERAEQYIQKMKAAFRCRQCDKPICIEEAEMDILLEDLKGSREEALEGWKRLDQIGRRSQWRSAIIREVEKEQL